MCAGLDAHPSDASLLLDDSDTLAELSRLNRRTLPGRPAADEYQIKFVRFHIAQVSKISTPQAHNDQPGLEAA